MPRKAATADTSDNAAAPRRSTRIKAQQPETKKAVAKPRTKKADKELDQTTDKPKSRGTKRKLDDEANGDDAPAVKKVDPVFCDIPLYS